MKKFVLSILVLSAVLMCTAYASPSEKLFTVVSIPYPEGKEIFENDYNTYSRLSARYCDDKTPIPLSEYYDGFLSATVPSTEASREIEAYIADDIVFSDYDIQEYAYYPMQQMAYMGVITGDEKGRALPFNNITRAEATAMIMRFLGVGAEKQGNGGFEDVSDDAWYAAAVDTAVRYGIVSGDSASVFSPEREVSREEFTAMAARALWCAGLKNENKDANAEDIKKYIMDIMDSDSISKWALSAYDAMGYGNILDTVDSQELDAEGIPVSLWYANPQKSATRGEAAEMLFRAKMNLQCYPSRTAVKYGFDKSMPVIDGSTSTYPFTEAVYNSLFSNGFSHTGKPASHSKSHASYARLINGEVDMLFASVYPASDIKELAAEKGVELELIPIAYDAMVFFTNIENSASNLTQKQITDIYVDNAYSNWNEIGGPDALLYPYCRNYDSGSHAQMERHFLNGKQINDKIRNETTSVTMSNVLTDVMGAETHDPDGYALGYSIYYYFNNMDLFYETGSRLKLLSVDGVFPTDKTIADGSYPLSNNTYIVLRADTPSDSPARRMAEFMLTEQGQQCVADAGFGPLKTFE